MFSEVERRPSETAARATAELATDRDFLGFLRSRRVVVIACAVVIAISAGLTFGLYVYPVVIEPAVLGALSADTQKHAKDDYTTTAATEDSSTDGKSATSIDTGS